MASGGVTYERQGARGSRVSATRARETVTLRRMLGVRACAVGAKLLFHPLADFVPRDSVHNLQRSKKRPCLQKAAGGTSTAGAAPLVAGIALWRRLGGDADPSVIIALFHARPTAGRACHLHGLARAVANREGPGASTLRTRDLSHGSPSGPALLVRPSPTKQLERDSDQAWRYLAEPNGRLRRTLLPRGRSERVRVHARGGKKVLDGAFQPTDTRQTVTELALRAEVDR